MTYSKNLFFILKTALKFSSTHVIILILLLWIFYWITGIPLYYAYDSWLKWIEIYLLYLIYSVIIFPINIFILNKKMKEVQYNKNVYQIKIYTAYILLFPAFLIIILSLLFGILV